MEKISFVQSIKELFKSFRYTGQLDDNVIGIWYSKLKHINDEAHRWIVDEIYTLDNLPRNIPLAFNRFYIEYQRSNPQKFISVKEDCESCQGRGFIIFKAKTPHPDYGYKPTYVAKCRLCNNQYFGMEAGAASSSEAELLNKGFEILKNDEPHKGRNFYNTSDIRGLIQQDEKIPF